ncbi:hypothetical protein [Epilithonimonas vandammei]|uniref:hypothetical protein n=1 Tax=Epilithonimonas vandammei TaxID=2487072 RepID=UPI0028A9BAEB|nr:hypothetical protein [Epilithonimonas vandammei]
MLPLDKDLQKVKSSINDFFEITNRVLDYFPNVINNTIEKGDYLISSSNIAGTIKFLRPINRKLFIQEKNVFNDYFQRLILIFENIRNKKNVTEEDKIIIDRVIYTIQQSIGIGLDLMVNQNSARKHVGNRFEELIRVIFTEISVSNKRTVLQIPYETDEGQKIYKCENDLIISPFENVESTNKHLDENEIVVSIKTTSKDRMGKMFIDKILLERFVKHPQKVIGIFLNDVQRKEDNNISFTLVSGLFMVYTKFLTTLEGIYYLDPPPNALKLPYSNHMKRFSDLITEDLEKLFSS